MISKRSRNILSYFLLLIYSFSMSPYIQFHYHDYNVADFEEADSCEKAIYYGDINDEHQEHLSVDLLNCFIDAEHIGSAHLLSSFIDFFHRVTTLDKEIPFNSKETYSQYFTSLGRDPPIFV